eukprot:7125509-Prymnesium_polylepis.1
MRLGDLHTAIVTFLKRSQAEEQEATGGGYSRPKRRFLWIDLLCVSQNVMTGRYPGRLEDISSQFLSVFGTTSELLLCASPIFGEWEPAQANGLPMLPDCSGNNNGKAAAKKGKVREVMGPRAWRRAWCLLE